MVEQRDMYKQKGEFYKEWFEKGIIMIHDILKEDGEFKTKQSLEDEFGVKIDILKYNGLKTAIPIEWRRCIKK